MDVGSCPSGKFKLYDQLELQEFQDKFVIKSVEAPDQGFLIDRRDWTIEFAEIRWLEGEEPQAKV
ncbi:unnamed protein product [Prunus armeniaca]|uniref:Uncharacterized protein n=1 Tax=Prunus armeniaca TaxID=36596 RepID=A0A6J5TRD6_PRUAR|nr:unnamed protein product [Prunus armeniaca]